MLCEVDIATAVAAVEFVARCEAYPGDQTRFDDAQKRQVVLLRDLYGNPFHPLVLDPHLLAWQHGLIPSLARQIDDERRFAEMPVLADALGETGCCHPAILEHCRSPGPHARGCHVLDMLLDKA